MLASPPSLQPRPPDFIAIVRRLAHHTAPVLVTQLLSMGMIVADTAITGRYGTADLAGVAVGSGLYISLSMLLIGILQAIAPIVAHHVGAGRRDAVGPALQQGAWLALALAVPGVLLMIHPAPLLSLAEVPPEVADKASGYLAGVAAGLPAVLLYRSFYAFINALGRPRVLMGISLLVTCLHVPLAWALCNGRIGLAPMGAAGCGTSTAVIAWTALALAVLYLRRSQSLADLRLFERVESPRLAAQLELLRLGVPMGLAIFVEISSFTLTSLFAARLGPEALAGHRIVLNIAGLAYMPPLALSIATLVMVGQAAGAHDWPLVRRIIHSAMVLGGGFALLLGFALWFSREPVVALNSTDPAVRATALRLIAFVCLYQFFDALQTIATHALRGLKSTLRPMLLSVACFWGIGLGGGYLLTFHRPGSEAPADIAGFWEASLLATLAAALLFGGLLGRVMRRRTRHAAE